MAKFRIISTTITEEAETEPVTVAEVKTYLQLVGDAYDTQLAIFISASRRQIENYANVSLTEKTIRAAIKNTAANRPFPLPFGDVAAITSVIFRRCASTLIDQESNYSLVDGNYLICQVSTFGEVQALTITYTTSAPPQMGIWKQAILAQVGYFYNNRDSEKEIQLSPDVMALVSHMRKNYY